LPETDQCDAGAECGKFMSGAAPDAAARPGRQEAALPKCALPKNIENNPMYSRRRPAWMPPKRLDTSGKSRAFLYDPAIP
jgi:hypothetical protein